MSYTEDYKVLKKIFSSIDDKVSYGSIDIYRKRFDSLASQILPGVTKYHCEKHDIEFLSGESYQDYKVGAKDIDFNKEDTEIEENKYFNYFIVMPSGLKKASKLTFLFHGFNEKDWSKYLPWAKSVCDSCGHAVILFPIAFHMDRAPKLWSDKRAMFKESIDRKKRYPNIVNCTLSNVAISMRLQEKPQRFIWSGLQSYYDVIDLIELFKKGNVDLIDPNFKFNLFAYSIGGFLAQILKYTNYKNYFSDSKLCLICSGAVFNRLSPVTKFILDSETNISLYYYLVEHIDVFMKKDNMLKHFINEHEEAKLLYEMMDFTRLREDREAYNLKYAKQIYAVTFKKDHVIPSYEIMNSLQGAYRNIPIKVEEFDFPYDYGHEVPFPYDSKDSNLVDEAYTLVFDKICDFLKI